MTRLAPTVFWPLVGISTFLFLAMCAFVLSFIIDTCKKKRHSKFEPREQAPCSPPDDVEMITSPSFPNSAMGNGATASEETQCIEGSSMRRTTLVPRARLCPGYKALLEVSKMSEDAHLKPNSNESWVYTNFGYKGDNKEQPQHKVPQKALELGKVLTSTLKEAPVNRNVKQAVCGEGYSNCASLKRSHPCCSADSEHATNYSQNSTMLVSGEDDCTERLHATLEDQLDGLEKPFPSKIVLKLKEEEENDDPRKKDAFWFIRKDANSREASCSTVKSTVASRQTSDSSIKREWLKDLSRF
ncbi:uncharacterized protein [Cherax quadricarinatus]